MKNIIFGYARVSSKEQNAGRQIEALKAAGVDERNIYVDKKSGENFDRKQYKAMIDRLREGDLIIVTSIDRLGRGYSEITEQWRHITGTVKANIKVLDLPLLDTSSNPQSLDSRFIADLVLQIISYVANKEREHIKKRQKEGIELMPVVDGKKVSAKTGKPTGRPKVEKPEQWDDIYAQWSNNLITAKAAMGVLGLKNNTFYKFVAEEQGRI